MGPIDCRSKACLQSERGYEDVDGVYHRGEAGVGFFVAGGDAVKRLYPAKEILDQMAPFIFLSVVAVGAFGSFRGGMTASATLRARNSRTLLASKALSPRNAPQATPFMSLS